MVAHPFSAVPDRDPDLEAMTPAMFAMAMGRIHSQPTLDRLCTSAAEVGSAALGPVWVALQIRFRPEEPLRPILPPAGHNAAWPAPPPAIPSEHLTGVFARLAGQPRCADRLGVIFAPAVDPVALAVVEQTLMPGMVCVAPIMLDGRGQGLVIVLARRAMLPPEALAALAANVATAAQTLITMERISGSGNIDPETYLLNPWTLDSRGESELERARRNQRPLGFLVVTIPDADIDALRVVGQSVLRIGRDIDAVARMDDRRIAMMLPDANLDATRIVAERIERINRGVRVSIASAPEDAVTWDNLVAVARGERTPEFRTHWPPSPHRPFHDFPTEEPVTDAAAAAGGGAGVPPPGPAVRRSASHTSPRGAFPVAPVTGTRAEPRPEAPVPPSMPAAYTAPSLPVARQAPPPPPALPSSYEAAPMPASYRAPAMPPAAPPPSAPDPRILERGLRPGDDALGSAADPFGPRRMRDAFTRPAGGRPSWPPRVAQPPLNEPEAAPGRSYARTEPPRPEPEAPARPPRRAAPDTPARPASRAVPASRSEDPLAPPPRARQMFPPNL